MRYRDFYMEKQKSEVMMNHDVTFAKDLSVLYDEICVVSERMRNCNSEFIQQLHEHFEEDDRYKSFRVAVLATCCTVIREKRPLSDYLKRLDCEIAKLAEISHAAIDEFDDGVDFWKALSDKAPKEKYAEVMEAFWSEHFLVAQRFVLGARSAKQNGDPLYMYKGPE